MKMGVRSKERKPKTLMQTYVTSMLSLLLSCAMLLSTTMAWFTSSVTSPEHEIYVGVLDVDLLNEGKSLKTENVKLFDNVDSEYLTWEPGATAYEFLTVRNLGDLAFNYDLTLTCSKIKTVWEEGTGKLDPAKERTVSEGNPEMLAIASAFDVYVAIGEQEVTSADSFKDLIKIEYDPADPDAELVDKYIAAWEKVGTLDEILSGKKVFEGTMTENDTEDDKYTVAIHMREEVGNKVDDYDIMGKTLVLNAKLEAVQKSYESDSFGPEYDMDQDTPRAIVTELADKKIAYATFGAPKDTPITQELDAAYSFRPTDSLTDAQESAYRYWHADYVISANKAVPADSVLLAGFYKAWCVEWNLSNGNWIGFTNEDMNVPAGEEIRLVKAMGNGGITVNYENICEYGNDGIGFLCGVADISGTNALAGTTITVELRLYETTKEPEAESGSANIETGDYITVGKTTYTFPKEPTEVSGNDELTNALTNAESGDTLVLDEGNYTLPSVSGKDVTISGTKDTVITVDKPNYTGSDVSFEGVTIKGSGYSTGVQHVNTVTYTDATIDGEMCLYGEKVVFNDCTFELDANQYIWTYGAKEVEFVDCTFNTAGKAILIYNEGAGATDVTVKNCVFNATGEGYAGDIANQSCAAIEINNFQKDMPGVAHKLTTYGNSYDSNFSGEWRIKKFVEGAAITVNGKTYETLALDGKLMTIDGDKKVTVSD